MRQGNIFAHIPEELPEEQFETLVGHDACRIERIVSDGQSSPPGFWYDQAQHEWVMVLRGAAELRYEDGTVLQLRPGDWTDIPHHTRHRVENTAPGTVWLAVHYPGKTTA